MLYRWDNWSWKVFVYNIDVLNSKFQEATEVYVSQIFSNLELKKFSATGSIITRHDILDATKKIWCDVINITYESQIKIWSYHFDIYTPLKSNISLISAQTSKEGGPITLRTTSHIRICNNPNITSLAFKILPPNTWLVPSFVGKTLVTQSHISGHRRRLYKPPVI